MDSQQVVFSSETERIVLYPTLPIPYGNGFTYQRGNCTRSFRCNDLSICRETAYVAGLNLKTLIHIALRVSTIHGITKEEVRLPSFDPGLKDLHPEFSLLLVPIQHGSHPLVVDANPMVDVVASTVDIPCVPPNLQKLLDIEVLYGQIDCGRTSACRSLGYRMSRSVEDLSPRDDTLRLSVTFDGCSTSANVT
jgi:hypothetical protein